MKTLNTALMLISSSVFLFTATAHAQIEFLSGGRLSVKAIKAEVVDRVKYTERGRELLAYVNLKMTLEVSSDCFPEDNSGALLVNFTKGEIRDSTSPIHRDFTLYLSSKKSPTEIGCWSTSTTTRTETLTIPLVNGLNADVVDHDRLYLVHSIPDPNSRSESGPVLLVSVTVNQGTGATQVVLNPSVKSGE